MSSASMQQDVACSLSSHANVGHLPRDIVSLSVRAGSDCDSLQPLQVGIPLPRGCLRDNVSLSLATSQSELPLQTEVLARWSDGSIKWLLLDTIANWHAVREDCEALTLRASPSQFNHAAIQCIESHAGVVVHTGAATFVLDRDSATLLRQVWCAGRDLLSTDGMTWMQGDVRLRRRWPRVQRIEVETAGPVRATVRMEGNVAGPAPCRLLARLSFFAGTGLVRVRFTVHNPRRARHAAGLWDLGDAGSIFFSELAICLKSADAASGRAEWLAEPGMHPSSTRGRFEFYQDSSGGENWASRNHVEREGKVTCRFRGYRARTEENETRGWRASPVAAVHASSGTISVALPEFWQQFPKAIDIDKGVIKVGFFPATFRGPHELQGGEQKTHTLWLQFGPAEGRGVGSLTWVHEPARLIAPPEWCAASGALPYNVHVNRPLDDRFQALLNGALSGSESFQARRELVDEYGWRNFGDLYADHEAAHCNGPPPVISHYNNQYDIVLGALLHYWRTGETGWWDIADPLARHVVDIDIYHTDQDKAAFNGGMFWHTDHYRDAATATHRTYSQANLKPNRPYGGGPCNEHNYTTGLLHYYYVTGDKLARDAVVSLSDWVLAMDDGRCNILGVLDSGPTGSASSTTERSYHGPGRGCGNSINALLDGWLLTNDKVYLSKAEQLIRRAIHPRDDVEGRNLGNTEMRWSYTVFLSVLGRYLKIKAEACQLDAEYAYAQASLLHYARWMLDHEIPYFDRPDNLEYPTETWAAQEVRKANAMRLAAPHADEPLRGRLLRRGNELSERAWRDLFRFARPGTTRAIAILLVEGLTDADFRSGHVLPAQRATTSFDFGLQPSFVPQRQRIVAALKTPRGVIWSLLRLANPLQWLTTYNRMSRKERCL